jgi:hypothetical protein
MTVRSLRRTARLLAGGVGIAAGVYAAHAGMAWHRYGQPPSPGPDEEDELLDRFMPDYDVVERHQVRVAAPAAATFAAAREQDLLHSPLVRAIFKARELVLRAAPEGRPLPRALLPQVLALGWGVLAEARDREIVLGAVTRPWEANVTFRALSPDEFAAFREPDYVKIVWTLRADPIGEAQSWFRTETRAVATDGASRARFRLYWAFASPGISMIRRLSLGPLKREAERRARA